MFERIFSKFLNSEKLGVASGTCFILSNNSKKIEKVLNDRRATKRVVFITEGGMPFSDFLCHKKFRLNLKLLFKAILRKT